MTDYQFTSNEFVDLAERLDALADVISKDERALLYAVFRMASDNLAQRSEAQSQGSNTANRGRSGGPESASSQLEALTRTNQATSTQSIATPRPVADVPTSHTEARLQALEERIGRLEAQFAEIRSDRGLEATANHVLAAPTVQLRTEGGGIPKLSDGFLNSFRGGQAARVMAADDTSVGINVGVMF